MSSALIAGMSAACMFGGTLLGLGLQRLLPKHHLSKDSQDVVKLGAGVVATIAALALGLLVSTAKHTLDEANSRMTQASAKIIILDGLLARYGPETTAAREELRRSVATLLQRMWPSEGTGVSGEVAIERGHGFEGVEKLLHPLVPGTDTQRLLLARSQEVLGQIAQSRLMLIEEAQNRLPTEVLVVLVFWLTLLFGSFGLFAPRNGIIVVVMLLCACSVAAAIFLVLEMNQPLSGSIKISSGPLRKALEILGR